MLERNLERRGRGAPIFRIPCVGPLIFSLLPILYSSKWRVPRDAMMG